MAGFNRGQKRFNCAGLDLNNPVDHVREDHYPYLKNVRSFVDGTIQPRNGISAVHATPAASLTPTHSFRRLTGTAGSEWARMMGKGASLTTESSAAAGTETALLAGLSGSPLSFAEMRPEQSLESWLVVGDANKNVKVNQDGTTMHSFGLDAPATGRSRGMNLPLSALDAPQKKEIDFVNYASDAAAQAAWSSGDTGVLPNANIARFAGQRINTTTTFVKFDSGTSGWASVAPASVALIGIGSITRGTILTVGAEAGVRVQEVHRGSSTAINISRIAYDNGLAPGFASVVLETETTDIEVGSLLLFTTGATVEYAVVLSVHTGPKKRTSFRVSLTGSHSASGNVTIVPSFRCYLAAGHTTGSAGTGAENVQAEAINLTPLTVGTMKVRRTVAVDLSSIATGLPVSKEDYVVMTMRATTISAVESMRIYLDVDSGTNDFTRNYFMYEVRQSELVQAADGSISLLDAREIINRRSQITDGSRGIKVLTPEGGDTGDFGGYPEPGEPETLPTSPGGETTTPDGGVRPVSSTGTGNSQWMTLAFRVGDLVRIGEDTSRSLRNVAAVQVEWVLTEVTTVSFDDLYLMGGYNPDTGRQGSPYYYRYRGRCSATGTASGYSPASRAGASPYRQRVIVTLSQFDANYGSGILTGVDKLDVERYGGTNIGWHYVGTVDNPAGATTTFTDDYADDTIAGNEGEDTPGRAPWPVIGTPVAGTTFRVAGTTVVDNGTTFNLNLAPGTEIKVGGILTSILRVISTSTLEIADSLGSQGTVSWEIPEPVILGQPLPVIVSQGYRNWALGDPLNPGRLYFTFAENAELTNEIRYLDLTSGSDPLMNAIEWNDRLIVFSNQRVWQVAGDDSANGASAVQLPIGTGLFARWGLCAADVLYFLGKDGIYASGGGDAKNLTLDKLGPIFPQEGKAGVTTNGIVAPLMTAANAANLRLNVCGAGRWLYFDYVGIDSGRHTLVCDLANGYWFYDTYTPGLTFHADDQGKEITIVAGGADAVTSKLYQVGGAITDAGTAIPCAVRTPSLDVGDPRMRKRWGDMTLEVAANGVTITAVVGYDNNATSSAGPAIPTTAGRVQTIIDLASGEGARAKNLSLYLTWSVAATETPVLYFWEPTWLNRPEGTILRATDYDDHGNPICKYVRGFYLEADTFGVNRQVTLRGDEGVAVIVGVTVNQSGKSRKYYPVEPPVYVYETSLIGTDTDEWDLYGYDLDFDPAPPESDGPGAWDDLGGARFVQGVVIDGDTEGANVNVAVEVDEGVVQTVIQAGANMGAVNINGRGQKAYSFDAPFITHLIRANPQTAMRLWKARWVFEPEPELARRWETQQTSHGLSGFQILKGGYLTIMSAATVVLQVVADGVTYTAVFTDTTNTGGNRRKIEFRLPVIKAKSFRYILTSTAGFRLYKDDCEVEVKQFGTNNSFSIARPFGDAHFASGARI